MPPFRFVPNAGGKVAGDRHCLNDVLHISVLEDVPCSVKHRNGVHLGGDEEHRGQTRWLVIELPGDIKLYANCDVDGRTSHIVISREELRPE